jgi:rRNA-processing protein FCF1
MAVDRGRAHQMSSEEKKKSAANSFVLIFDTDFLMKVTNDPLPQVYDLIRREEYKLVTLGIVERELKGLSNSRKPSVSKRAQLALRSLGSMISVEKDDTQRKNASKAEADVQLIERASRSNGREIIATLDGSLLSRLEKRRVSYLTLRNNKPFLRTFSQQRI